MTEREVKIGFLENCWGELVEDMRAPVLMVVEAREGGAFDIWAPGVAEGSRLDPDRGIDWAVRPMTAEKARGWLAARGFAALPGKSGKKTFWTAPEGGTYGIGEGREHDCEFLAWALESLLCRKSWYTGRDATPEDIADI